jgi:hypothetical protein
MEEPQDKAYTFTLVSKIFHIPIGNPSKTFNEERTNEYIHSK